MPLLPVNKLIFKMFIKGFAGEINDKGSAVMKI